METKEKEKRSLSLLKNQRRDILMSENKNLAKRMYYFYVNF